MKYRLILMVFIFLLGACQAPIPSERMELMDELPAEPLPWYDLAIFEQNLTAQASPVIQEMSTAPYYLLRFELDPSQQRIKGTLLLRYTNTSADQIPFLVFQLFPVVYGGRVILGEITVNEQPVSMELQENGSILYVDLPEVMNPGASVAVYIPFESTIPREMGGNYGLYGYFDDILVLDGFYPLLAVYDHGEWHHHITSPNGDIKYEEMSFYQVTAEIPSALKVISSGQVTRVVKHADLQTVTFIAGPVREFYMAASKNFVTYKRQIGDVLLLSTGLKGREDVIMYALDIGEGALLSYSARFGAYPYRELDLVSTPMLALGMEYPGVSTITSRYYELDISNLETANRDNLDSVIAHEIGHQWFFNLVGNDQMEEPWLDEALTQYLVGLFYEDYYNESAAEAYRESWNSRWGSVNFDEIPIGLPSYAYDPLTYGAIIYGRGPYFIEALENQLGEEKFMQALQNYFQAYEWHNATTNAFKQEMEAVCECNLNDLFAEWVYP
jgi:hypothetical protein